MVPEKIKTQGKGVTMNVKGLIGAMVVSYVTICITTRVGMLKSLAGL